MRNIFAGITLGLFIAFSFKDIYQAAMVALIFGLFAYYKWHQYYRWFINKLSFDSKNIYIEFTDKGKTASAVLARETSTVSIKHIWDKAATPYLEFKSKGLCIKQCSWGADWTESQMNAILGYLKETEDYKG